MHVILKFKIFVKNETFDGELATTTFFNFSYNAGKAAYMWLA